MVVVGRRGRCDATARVHLHTGQRECNVNSRPLSHSHWVSYVRSPGRLLPREEQGRGESRGKNLISVQGTTWTTLFDFLLFVLERAQKRAGVWVVAAWKLSFGKQLPEPGDVTAVRRQVK